MTTEQYNEKFKSDNDSWRNHESTEVFDETGKIVFSVSICSDSPEDHTFFRDLSDCREVARLLNEAYEKGFKAGETQSRDQAITNADA